MKTNINPGEGGIKPATARPLLWTLLLLVVILTAVFHRSLSANNVIFSNDGPLGALEADQDKPPSIIRGLWMNLNWLGGEGMAAPPDVSIFLLTLLGAVDYARFYVPLTLFFIGLCACFCFRQLKLSPLACVLGGLAAALGSNFFSTSCWGVASQVVGCGAMFAAVGLAGNPTIKRQWIRVALAGLAVGLGVMEAYDIGALFSLFVAAFVVYHSLFMGDDASPAGLRIGKGILRAALVAGFAAFIAAHSLVGLVGTQIQGISGAQQDAKTKALKWPEATQWSVPKAESLQVVVPGLFGFRDDWYMYEYDMPKEDQYWGAIGEGGGLRHLIGTGFYAGIPVVIIALFAAFQSFRRESSAFTKSQRRAVWFWLGVLVISLLFAFGKNAPFYQFFYALPYASAIRNPAKFMHVFSWALVILFAYGVNGLSVLYLRDAAESEEGFLARFKKAFAAPFERKWLVGSVGTMVLGVVAWLVYSSQSSHLKAHLLAVGVPETDVAGVAAFSLEAVGWFVLFLALTLGLLALIVGGQFSGPRLRLGGILLGALLVVDLGRADLPWLVYWERDYKYGADPVIDFLADKPYEHRVAMVPPDSSMQGTPQLGMLFNVYGNDWKQHLFLAKNIQCSEVVQEPRVALDKETFLAALTMNNIFNYVRFWQLSNTRYLLCPADFARQRDPEGKFLRILKTFNFVPKPPHPGRANPGQYPADYTTEFNPKGELAIVEFVPGLPRAKLYANWQVSTNDQSTLQALGSQAFDPQSMVLVADNNIPAPAATNLSQNPGTVQVNANYKSKRVELSADVKIPSVLWLSERYNPKWRVKVDGQPVPLLRCDYLMRGVYLTTGKHEVVMEFVAPTGTLWVSLAAIALGLILSGFLMLSPAKEEPAEPAPATVPVKNKFAAN